MVMSLFLPGSAPVRQSYGRPIRGVAAAGMLLLLPGCATMGSLMSPYSEKFSCRNDDHGQCIHPQRAYEDAVADVSSRSSPAVTRDKRLLGEPQASRRRARQAVPDAYGSYRASVYNELRGLLEAPVTPMLKPARTVRTLILPYADRQRPDRLYMPRYVYSIIDKPAWVVGDALVDSSLRAGSAPVLGQTREKSAQADVIAPAEAKEPRR